MNDRILPILKEWPIVKRNLSVKLKVTVPAIIQRMMSTGGYVKVLSEKTGSNENFYMTVYEPATENLI